MIQHPTYALLPLHGLHGEGLCARVDPKDLELVGRWRWWLSQSSRNRYVYTWEREPFNPSEWERGEHEPPAPRADGWIYGPRKGA